MCHITRCIAQLRSLQKHLFVEVASQATLVRSQLEDVDRLRRKCPYNPNSHGNHVLKGACRKQEPPSNQITSLLLVGVPALMRRKTGTFAAQ
jgi:hypothetical protein